MENKYEQSIEIDSLDRKTLRTLLLSKRSIVPNRDMDIQDHLPLNKVQEYSCSIDNNKRGNKNE